MDFENMITENDQSNFGSEYMLETFSPAAQLVTEAVVIDDSVYMTEGAPVPAEVKKEGAPVVKKEGEEVAEEDEVKAEGEEAAEEDEDEVKTEGEEAAEEDEDEVKTEGEEDADAEAGVVATEDDEVKTEGEEVKAEEEEKCEEEIPAVAPVKAESKKK